MTMSISMGIVLELLQQGKTTASTIAKKFEISTRSVYRCVDALCCAGFPLITQLGRKGGIYLSPEFILKNLCLSKDELSELIDMCKKAKPYNRSLCEKLKYASVHNYT